MRAVAIDDDPNMLELLTTELDRLALDVKLVGTASNFRDGVGLIRREEPKLLFLDIELDQGMTGFDVLRSLEHTKYAVVFISGKKDYGDLVVRFSALAYLYKPLNPAHLAEAVALARTRLKEKEYQENLEAMLADALAKKLPTILVVANAQGRHPILLTDILYIYGEKEVIRLYRAGRKPVIKGTALKTFENDLKRYPEFMRVNRNYIINLYHMDLERAGGPALVMKDNTEIEVSSAMAKKVRKRLAQL